MGLEDLIVQIWKESLVVGAGGSIGYPCVVILMENVVCVHIHFLNIWLTSVTKSY